MKPGGPTPVEMAFVSRAWPSSALLLLLLSADPAWGQSADRSIPYRGHLDQNGVPQSGLYSMRFELFAAATGGPALLTVNQDLQVTAGEFATTLSPVPEAVLDSPALFLQISVAPRGQPLVLLPRRQQIQAVPYAGRAEVQKDFRVGPAVLDGGGHLRTPAFQVFQLITDSVHGTPGGPISWADGDPALCAPLRGNCFGFRRTIMTRNGTTVLTIEASAFRFGQGGPMALDIRLDPRGTNTRLASMQINTNEGNTHRAFPTMTIVIPRSLTDCAAQLCVHELQIVPESGSRQTDVDNNDYLRVTGYELPF